MGARRACAAAAAGAAALPGKALASDRRECHCQTPWHKEGTEQSRTGAGHGSHFSAEAGGNQGLLSVELGNGRVGGLSVSHFDTEESL